MRRIEMGLREYIESRCAWVGECFEWQGAKPNGYGIFQIPGTRENAVAHRVLYVEVHGPIPRDYVVMHKCDNPSCCNIKHLKAVTQFKNVRDSQNKGRKKHGSFSPKLGAKEHKQIIKLSKTVSDYLLAGQFGVSPSTIARIRRGETKVTDGKENARKAANTRWAKHRAEQTKPKRKK